MCTLTFDYDSADTHVDNDLWFLFPSFVGEEDKVLFEKRINAKYKDYCSRINESGGRIIVGYTVDGKEIIRYQLECPEKLFLEIQERIGSE